MAATAAKKATVTTSAVICRAIVVEGSRRLDAFAEVRRARIGLAPCDGTSGLQPDALPVGHLRAKRYDAPSRCARYSLRWLVDDMVERVRGWKRKVKA